VGGWGTFGRSFRDDPFWDNLVFKQVTGSEIPECFMPDTVAEGLKKLCEKMDPNTDKWKVLWGTYRILEFTAYYGDRPIGG
jgi:hypothetical protein